MKCCCLLHMHINSWTSDSMYGQSDINVEATDVDGEVGTMAEEESWFLNPVVSLGVEGSVNFSNLRLEHQHTQIL